MTGRNFVLIHGGRHGGWCWKKVTPLLRRAGHDVYVVTLTGMGERRHLLTPAVNLETHIQDVIGVLRDEDMQEPILVGHSYGGMIIAGVADAIPKRVGRCVYLDALVPRSGDSVMSMAEEHLALGYLRMVRESGDGWRLPPLTPPQHYGITDPEDVAWAAARLSAQPFATYTQPLVLHGHGKDVPSTYIRCTRGSHKRDYERAREAGWPLFDIDATHDAMVTEPVALAECLVKVAQNYRAARTHATL